MRVTYDLALSIELLRGREVVGLRVHKVTGLHALDGHANSEGRIWGDVLQVRGVLELRRRHCGGCGDLAHRCWVARSCFYLLTVCERLLCRGAKVNEVVRRSERRRLTRCGGLVTI